MLNEYGQSLTGEDFETPQLITAILPHPYHGRLVERVLLMVTHQINLKGLRYVLSWRDHDLAFYQPVGAR
ncbi:MAG: hypothetical protein ACOZFS_05515 [Thermodesulfobacteriota bacterium]